MKFSKQELIFSAQYKVDLADTIEDLGRSSYSIVIRTEHSIISVGTELALLAGLWSPSGKFPIVPNAMVVGRIVLIGPAAALLRPDLKVDDRVLVKGRHASFVECNALVDDIYRLSNEMPAEAALLARQALVTSRSVARGAVAAEVTTLVVGLGLIGQLIVRFAVYAGSTSVMAADRHLHRRDVAKRAGSVTVDCDRAYPRNDVTFIACPDPEAVRSALACLSENGTLVLVAGSVGEVRLDLGQHVFRRNIRILGAHERFITSNSAPRSTQLIESMRILGDGSINTQGLITKIVRPDHLRSLYNEYLRCKNDYVGLLVDWS